MNKQVITRFAPSPTGHMHIGNLRSALFSYLIAKKHHGKFILRIEDTDRNRSIKDVIGEICRQLNWIGINWDQGPIYQSSRLPLYQNHAEKLISSGRAYRCFCSIERLNQLHLRKEQDRGVQGYDKLCRNLSESEVLQKIEQAIPSTVRIKIPDSGVIKVEDYLRGPIEFECKTLEDLVLLKTDGFPTYHLAHPVDDSLMEVTHVFRGTEWIPTSPIHALIFDSLGYQRPTYCHMPLILSRDGGKLSKRDGATTIDEFIEQGYLPEALLNYLVLLGWSYDDKREFFTIKELESLFDIDKISKAPAAFNIDKLNFFNSHYIKKCDVDTLFNLAKRYFDKCEYDLPNKRDIPYSQDKLKDILRLVQVNLKTLGEIPTVTKYFFSRSSIPANYGEIISKDFKVEVIKKSLNAMRELILDDNSKCSSGEMLKKLVDIGAKVDIKNAELFVPIRVAITGQKSSPSIVDIVAILGREESLSRIDHALTSVSGADGRN